MIKRNALIFTLTAAVIASLSFMRDNDLDRVVYAFNNSGLVLEEVRIKGWVKIKDATGEKIDLGEAAGSICNSLGIKFITGDIKNDGDNKVTFNREFEEGDVCISVEKIGGISPWNNEYIAAVDVTQCGNLMNINSIRKRVFESLSKTGSNPFVDICVTGCAEGILDGSAVERLLLNMLRDLNADVADTVKDDNIISICGYTRNIDDFIKYGNEKVNINVAGRVSPSCDKTYFWLGTPVINMEY